MDIEALRSLLSAVRAHESRRRIVIFGSSALLISLTGATPAELGVETTLDADLLLDPDEESVRRALDEALGSDSEYDATHGFHADFTDARIARDCFPPGWQQRLVPVAGFDAVFALSTSDTAAAKLLATAFSRLNRRMGRGTADRGMKDIQAVAALHACSTRWNCRNGSNPWNCRLRWSWKRAKYSTRRRKRVSSARSRRRSEGHGSHR